MSDDQRLMRRALSLAAGALTRASPNPGVGAVLVDADRVYEGATAEPGGPHAEAAALAIAPDDLSGATAYVTLEPCWPFPGKRTPSCALALVERGVRRVVVAMEDPNPHVRGHGVHALRAAGIEVVVGVLEDEARELLADYAARHTMDRLRA